MKIFSNALKFIVLTLTLFSLNSCNLPPVLATLEATVIDPSDSSGSSYAVVNFTQFFAVNNNSGAELQFTNPEGDSMTITIANASTGNYTIGGLNQVTGQITITRNLEPVSQAISSSAGSISITGIGTDGNEIVAAQGSFEINLDGGGSATSMFDGRR